VVAESAAESAEKGKVVIEKRDLFCIRFHLITTSHSPPPSINPPSIATR